MFNRYFRQFTQSPDGLLWMPADFPGSASPQSSKLASNVDPVVLASAAGVGNVWNGYWLTVVSGTNAITAIKVPSGFRGTLALRPTGAFTGATGGAYASDGVTDTIPIGLAFTAVVGKILFMTTDGLLFYPSYTA